MNGKGLWSTPVGLLVILVICLYVTVTAVYLATKEYFVRSPDRTFAKADYQPGDIVFDPTRIPEKTGKKTQPVDLAKAVKETPVAIKKGKSLFEVNCASCHGQNGMGDGPAAATLDPKPRNFTSPKGWTNGYSLVDIFRTLTRGVKGSAMVAYDTLSVQERFDLAHYVQSFGNFQHGDVTSEDLVRLDEEFHLSKGVKEPNHAPVDLVMKNMVTDYKAKGPSEFKSSGFTPGELRLYRWAVTDPVRAAQTLALVKGWKKNPEVFARAVTGGAPENGFSAAVGTFSESEWRQLQTILAQQTSED